MLRGRRGHARVIVLTVVPEELDAVREEFGAWTEVETEEPGQACWTTSATNAGEFGVLVTQSQDRSNMPAQQTTRDLIEEWQPEVIVLVGVAGGIVRANEGDTDLDGLTTGDVVCIEFVHYADYVKRAGGQRQPRYFPLQHPDTNLITSHVRPLADTPWYAGIAAPRPGPAQSPEVKFGELVAVEFLAGDGGAVSQQDALGGYDHALAVDMESAGVARALHTASRTVHYRPVWIGIRGISDRTAASEFAYELLGEENDAERRQWRDYAAASAARFAHLAVQRILQRDRPPSEDSGASKWVSAR
jgi:nucleoside phosphorylase